MDLVWDRDIDRLHSRPPHDHNNDNAAEEERTDHYQVIAGYDRLMNADNVLVLNYVWEQEKEEGVEINLVEAGLRYRLTLIAGGATESAATPGSVLHHRLSALTECMVLRRAIGTHHRKGAIMPLKAVIHVDAEDIKILVMALGNIRNLLDQIQGERPDVRMIANHHAVNFFKKEDAGKHAETIAALAEEGVRFLICNNSIHKLGIDRTSLLEQCEVVPAGIFELVRLQSQGFAYVKP